MRTHPDPDHTQALNKSSKKLPGLSPRGAKGEVAAAPVRVRVRVRASPG